MLFYTRLSEGVGTVMGWIAGPVFAFVSAARRARTFHPDGAVFLGNVTPLDAGDALGERLRGPVLVRFSSAVWKKPLEWMDVLGCALRFRSTERVSHEPDVGDQDLLFATIKRPWTTPFAPLSTHFRDYLSNDYFAVSPFDVYGVGRVYWRLRPRGPSPRAFSREDRLDRALAQDSAVLRLSLRKAWTRRWIDVADVALLQRVEIDQEALRFSPFRAGREIRPRGLIHALRKGVYTLSQRARPART